MCEHSERGNKTNLFPSCSVLLEMNFACVRANCSWVWPVATCPLPRKSAPGGRFVGRSGSTRSASRQPHSLRTQRTVASLAAGNPSRTAGAGSPLPRGPVLRRSAPRVFPQTRVTELHLPAAGTGRRGPGGPGGDQPLHRSPEPPVQEATPRVCCSPQRQHRGPNPSISEEIALPCPPAPPCRLGALLGFILPKQPVG